MAGQDGLKDSSKEVKHQNFDFPKIEATGPRVEDDVDEVVVAKEEIREEVLTRFMIKFLKEN